ncbi:MAG: rhodanese-like domain-containing protein [Planctomycetota bacterium]|nr:rhodanese-like domain-containing protein [Planctomycetota bacterium]
MSATEENLPLEIDCRGVKKLLDEGVDFFLLDCREPSEYAIAKLDSAVLIPMGEIPARLPELEPVRDRRIVVHCHHGGRSMQVTQWLQQQGFPKVQNMAGGIDAWSHEIDSSVARY